MGKFRDIFLLYVSLHQIYLILPQRTSGKHQSIDRFCYQLLCLFLGDDFKIKDSRIFLKGSAFKVFLKN